jgi:hypothetical protein
MTKGALRDMTRRHDPLKKNKGIASNVLFLRIDESGSSSQIIF